MSLITLYSQDKTKSVIDKIFRVGVPDIDNREFQGILLRDYVNIGKSEIGFQKRVEWRSLDINAIIDYYTLELEKYRFKQYCSMDYAIFIFVLCSLGDNPIISFWTKFSGRLVTREFSKSSYRHNRC